MAESSWPASEVTQEHLQNLVSKEYVIAAEFATCLGPMYPVSPALVKGYVIVCAAFYEWGFGVTSHLCLHYQLWSYGLELHHLTPSRIQGDAKGLVRKVALLEGELVEAHQAREVAKEKVHNLSSSVAEGV
jgi:hypothetical protein